MKTSRPDKIEYFMEMAKGVSSRATCSRRDVGCVLVSHLSHVLATGYNGTPRGVPHCIQIPCPGATAKSGEKLDACCATHAEANALLQCSNVEEISAAYVTASPCTHCIKLLMNTSCSSIYFEELYPHSDALKLWEDVGRLWFQVKNGTVIKASI